MLWLLALFFLFPAALFFLGVCGFVTYKVVSKNKGNETTGEQEPSLSTISALHADILSQADQVSAVQNKSLAFSQAIEAAKKAEAAQAKEAADLVASLQSSSIAAQAKVAQALQILQSQQVVIGTQINQALQTAAAHSSNADLLGVGGKQ